MFRMPNFLAMIEDCRCINLSAYGKQLKPETDLATSDQQRNLGYVLDIFPGLYCQKWTPADPQPRATVSKPVLIVSFVSRGGPQRRKRPLDPILTMDGEVGTPLHTRNSNLTSDKSGAVRDGEAPHRAVQSHGVEDADIRTAQNSRKAGGNHRRHSPTVTETQERGILEKLKIW